MDSIIAQLRAAGEPTRLRIVTLLAQGELTVSEFVQILGQSQPRVSRHLKLLADAGLVQRLPEGSWAFYRLAEPAEGGRALVDAIIAATPQDTPELARDRARLAAAKRARAQAAAAYFADVARDWDRIRALHLDEADVERAVVDAAGPGPFQQMVDVGVGSGRMLELFADRIARGLGVDLSHEMLTVARDRLDQAGFAHCSVRHGDLYALPLPDASADLVTVHLVLHHLDAPGAAIAEAVRVLRPGGRLLIVDFAPHELEFLRQRHAHRRLGFADEEVAEWLVNGGLRPIAPLTLTPDAPPSVTPHQADGAPPQDGVSSAERLVVKIWRADAPKTAGADRIDEPSSLLHVDGDAA